MNFGMFTDFHIRDGNSQAEAFDESFAQIIDAENLGFDTVWLAEHHFSPERAVLASPMVIASAIAARTERIRTGLAVQVLPLTNPLRVAEEAATVDHISKGRFEFGIGRSGLTRYYQGYNIPYSESRPRFLEALEIIMKSLEQRQADPRGRVPLLPGRAGCSAALPAALPAGAGGGGRGGHLPAHRQHGPPPSSSAPTRPGPS